MKSWIKVLMAGILFAGIAASAMAGTPTVNGLFYGDGDDANYLYLGENPGRGAIYYKQEGTMLYMAVLVDTNVNDNVFGDSKKNSQDRAYTESAGWNNHHTFDALLGSDHLEIKLQLDSNTPYDWFQDYLYQSGGAWLSDPAGPDGNGTPPSGLVSASSLQWNMINSIWDITLGGTRTTGETYKSPDTDYDNSVLDEDYATHNTAVDWEWTMVYEMSVDIGNAQTFVMEVASAHNSPAKTGGEDVPIPLYDFGDAPDTYGTLDASSGPSHKIVLGPAAPRLGALIDAEVDGQPTVGAVGDDTNGSDDEDGLLAVSALNPGTTASITVVGTAGAKLNAWLDFNGDGDFDDAGEEITVALGYTLSGGSDVVSFSVPGAANLLNPPYLRLRVSSAGGLTPYGEAADGEVEDYQLTASIGDKVWEDPDKDGIQGNNPNEKPIINVQVDLYTAGDVWVATDFTDINGNYGFSGLTPATYYVVFHAPSNYKFSPKDAGGDDELDSDADPTSGKTDLITLSVGENNSTVDAGLWFNPTLVVLSDFGAIERNGGVVVYWQTSSELGTIGFFLERLDPTSGQYVQVNDAIIPGALFANENNQYEVTDPGVAAVGSHTYRLIELENTGIRNTYGPFEVAFASAPQLEETELVGAAGAASIQAPELAVTAMTVGKGHMVLRWASVDGASYRIERATSIIAEFEVIAEGIAATAPENALALIDGAAAGFYRVIAE